jgi:toxin ParE1/3/4
MPRYLIRPAADRDLDEQAGYLAEHASLEIALRFYDAASESISFLAKSPGVGAPYESGNPALAGVRIWRVNGFSKHLIVYRPIEEGIEVVRVLHGNRDIDSILGRLGESRES